MTNNSKASAPDRLKELEDLLFEQQAPTPTSGLDPYTGPWTRKQVIHLLKRCLFGAKKADVDYFLNGSAATAVNELLTPSPPPNLL